MKVDCVELTLAVEDALLIYLPDEESDNVKTVGDLHRLVLELVGSHSQSAQLSRALYRTRRGLSATSKVSRREIQPSTLLAPLLPWKERRLLWPILRSEIGLNLPDLEHPEWIGVSAGVTVLLIDAFLNMTNILQLPVVFKQVLSLSLALVFGGFLVLVTWPLAKTLPANVRTAGDLAKSLVPLNPARLAPEPRWQNEEAVWDALRNALAPHLGIAAGQIDAATPL